MKAYIGIDLGTGSLKGILSDCRGNIISSASEEYGVSYPKQGWSEQNPSDWEKAFYNVLKELTSDFEGEVAGISFGGQMHGLVALDKDGNVIRPCILWNDGRTEKQTELLNTHPGREELTKLTGNIAYAGFTAPKLLWMYENERENFDRIAHILLPKDYLVYLLTGKFATDVSDASGMLLLDVEHKCWSKPMCGYCRISEDMLPEIYESYDVVGNVTPAAAALTGLSENTKVIAGAGDNAAAAIGTATVKNGDCNISLGTSGTVFIASDKYNYLPGNALHSFAHANGKFHLMGCILSAASCQSWWLENILNSNDYENCINENDIGRNSVYFLPYLTGERSPHNDVNATGVFIGLRPDTTREQMTLAVWEGVTFALLDCLNIARENSLVIDRTTLCGGGAKSKIWRQMIADICNVDVYMAKTEQGPSAGGVILAATGCSEYTDINTAVENMTSIVLCAAPDKEKREMYEERYARWKKIYPALKAVYPEIR